MSCDVCRVHCYLAQHGILCLQPASSLQKVLMGSLRHGCNPFKLAMLLDKAVDVTSILRPFFCVCLLCFTSACLCRDVQREQALAGKRNPQPPRVVMLLPLSQVCFFVFSGHDHLQLQPKLLWKALSHGTSSVTATHVGLLGTHMSCCTHLHGIVAPPTYHKTGL